MECFYNLVQSGVSINRVTIDRKPLVFESNNNTTNTKTTNDAKITTDDFTTIFQDGRRDMANIVYSKVTLNEFNKTIGAIMAADNLDLTIPANLPNTLEDLKFD